MSVSFLGEAEVKDSEETDNVDLGLGDAEVSVLIPYIRKREKLRLTGRLYRLAGDPKYREAIQIYFH